MTYNWFSFQTKILFLFPVRCKVPECDIGENNRAIAFNQSWLQFAIPSNDTLDSCVRYAPLNGQQSAENVQCGADFFNTSSTVECSEYIYASDESNVQTEVENIINQIKTYFSNIEINQFFSSTFIALISVNWHGLERRICLAEPFSYR